MIAGPDPAPRRLSVPTRLVVLSVAIAVHAGLSQLMYAGLYVRIPVPPDQLQAGAQLMYYGGDIAELLLALAMVSTWRPRRARRRQSGLDPIRFAFDATLGSARNGRSSNGLNSGDAPWARWWRDQEQAVGRGRSMLYHRTWRPRIPRAARAGRGSAKAGPSRTLARP